MKKIICLLTTFCLVVACQQAEPRPKDISVSGQIENSIGDTLRLSKDMDVQKFAVAAEGAFEGTFNGDAGYYTLSYNRENTAVYLEPGDQISIHLDTKEFDESLKYEGTSAQINNYLAKKFLTNEELQKNMDMKSMYSLDESAFKEVLSKQKQAMLELLNSSDLPETFSKLESHNIDFEFLGMAKNYEFYYQYFTKDSEFKVSEEFNKQFAEIDFQNEYHFKMIPKYKDFVLNHFSGGELVESLGGLKEVSSPVIKAAVVERLTNWLSPGTENLLDRVNEMKALVEDDVLKAELDAKYESMKMLVKGNASPGFNFKKVDGEMVDLNDLKGKSVYVDVWATWCGPCKAEIPHLKTLESEYHGKDIEFVSISVDVPTDEQKWKDMVAEKELKGIQLMSDNGWDTDFVKEYLIRGIPRFILIDKNGKIISADAPRPSSDKKIKDMIDEMLVNDLNS